MKIKPMKPAESRIAAIALLLLALLLAYFVLVHWWLVAPLREISGEMDDLRDAQARYAATIAEKPQLQQRLATIGEGQAASAAFLPEDDPNAAAANLMQKVVDVAAAHPQGGTCEVTQKMPVPTPANGDSDPYQKAAVNIGMHCDIEPLAAVLHDLEQGTPYLFIDNISIYRNPAIVQNPAGGPATGQSGASLEVQFTVSGYVRQSRAPASAGTPAATGGAAL